MYPRVDNPRNAARSAVLLSAIVFLSGLNLLAQEVHLKSRNLSAPPAGSQPYTGRHQIVVFDHAPDVEDIGALLQKNAQVVSSLPDNAVVVSGPRGALRSLPRVAWTMPLEVEDKLSPALPSLGVVDAIVEFHPDVSQDQQDAVAELEGIELQRPAVLNANHAVVHAEIADLRALAAHDPVAYIFPADPDLLTDAAFKTCAGMLTASGPVAQYANLIHGWDLGPDGAAHLGYVFGSLTTKVPAATVQSEIVRALNEWTKHTNVIFSASISPGAARTVLIKFTSGAHGDAYPFDGPGGMLAHTFYPVPVNPESIAGDMHLDADENWHAGADLDIYSVALHEAGHALGLGHSDKPGDVMYPYYRSGMSLSANDIGAIQALYGKISGGVSASVTQQPSSTNAKPLTLILDSPPAAVQTSTTSLTGTVTGGASPYSVQWQTDRGYSGRASLNSSTNSWTAGPIALVNGSNTISVSAFDAAKAVATQAATIAFNPPQVSSSPGVNQSPITVSITSPASSVTTINAATASLAGTASGGAGITRVTWQTTAGASGVASGTNHWVANTVPLLKGSNTIVIRAYDANGNNSWAALVAVRNY